jgi:hypothetical protein
MGFSSQGALLPREYLSELAQAGLLTLMVWGGERPSFLGQYHFSGL